MLDQVEERLLAPLDVVEDDHQRLLGRSLLERLAKRPGDLICDVLARLAQQRADRRGSRSIGRRTPSCFSTSTTGQ